MHAYPLIATLVYLSLTSTLGWLYPIPVLSAPYWHLAGWLLLAGGAVIIVLASGLFRLHGTTVHPGKAPDKLLTHGIYRYSRNPMYLGMLLMLIGLPLLRDFLPGLLFAVLFFLFMDRRQIPREEQRILDEFGAAFRDYQHNTRRWL